MRSICFRYSRQNNENIIYNNVDHDDLCSSLRRGNDKSKDNRYHHHNITVDLYIESSCFGFFSCNRVRVLQHLISMLVDAKDNFCIYTDDATVLFVEMLIYISSTLCHSV